MELRFLNVKMTSSIFLVLILSNHEGDTTNDGGFGQRGIISPGDSYHDLWTMWKKVYGKENFREEVRNKNWVSNYHKVMSHNKRFFEGKETYQLGMNRFADHTGPELTAMLLQYIPVTALYKNNSRLVSIRAKPIPSEMNWSDDVLIPAVRFSDDVYPHGWALSAIEVFQTRIKRVSGIVTKLSWEELVECVPVRNGRPFTTLDAFSFIKSRGVLSHIDYATKKVFERNACESSSLQVGSVKIKDYQLLQPGNENMLKVAVAVLGPVSVSIMATDNFFFYKSGVFYDIGCRPGKQRMVNHAVSLVGYGSDPSGGEDYWIIHNNWGRHWGENGFGRMARNVVVNCEIDSLAVYPTL